jgi:hypothetical protein
MTIPPFRILPCICCLADLPPRGQYRAAPSLCPAARVLVRTACLPVSPAACAEAWGRASAVLQTAAGVCCLPRRRCWALRCLRTLVLLCGAASAGYGGRSGACAHRKPPPAAVPRARRTAGDPARARLARLPSALLRPRRAFASVSELTSSRCTASAANEAETLHAVRGAAGRRGRGSCRGRRAGHGRPPHGAAHCSRAFPPGQRLAPWCRRWPPWLSSL